MTNALDGSEILTDAIQDVTRRRSERLEYEALGAWRADYDYLHVYSRTHLSPSGPKTIFRPSNREEPHDRYTHSQYWSATVYDLRWLFPSDVEQLR